MSISNQYKLMKLRSSLCLGLVIWTFAANAAADVEIYTINCEVNPNVIIDLNSSVPGVLGAVPIDRCSLGENELFTKSEGNHGRSLG